MADMFNWYFNKTRSLNKLICVRMSFKWQSIIIKGGMADGSVSLEQRPIMLLEIKTMLKWIGVQWLKRYIPHAC